MKIVDRLLRKNLSGAQLAGFVLSNFIGLAIVIAGLQFYEDVKSIWEGEDSFIKKDYLVINKKVTSANTLGSASSDFSEQEIADLEKQPWVRRVGRFSSPLYRVMARMSQGGRALITDFFYESIPSSFIDLGDTPWRFDPVAGEVPIIISKDYLTLYNFGFASSAGMPQVSEQLMSSLPVDLVLTSPDGSRSIPLKGRITGYSNRLNTILVPQEFMEWSNQALGVGATMGAAPRRLIVDVSSPGDVAIDRYLSDHDLELAGDKSGSRASYMLNVVTGVMLAVGVVITVLSFFILLLSISLLMQKNRAKLHALLMLGYDPSAVGAPYRRLIVFVSFGAWALAAGAMFLVRSMYIHRIAGVPGAEVAPVWLSLGAGLLLALATIAFNLLGVSRRIRASFLT